MREIKFRAWDENKKRMIFPTSIVWNGLRTSVCFDHSSPKEDVSDEFPEGYVVGITDSDFPLMQFTGLLDKNGKEIYEGDIVEWQSGDDVSRMAVHFRVEYGRCMTIPYINSKCEVIGNIHENPDLLA